MSKLIANWIVVVDGHPWHAIVVSVKVFLLLITAHQHNLELSLAQVDISVEIFQFLEHEFTGWTLFHGEEKSHIFESFELLT